MFIFNTRFFNQNLSVSKRHRAFTLSEVLITLSIIGVVAAITIPALIKNTNNQEYKVAWKKEYSALSNAYKRLAFDEGGAITYPSNASVIDDVSQYLNVTSKTYYLCNGDYSNMRLGGSCYYGTIRLTDGSLVVVSSWGWGLGIDINGDKPPNIPGHDIFAVTLTADGRLIPYGTAGSGTTSSCNPNPPGAGYGDYMQQMACSTQYLME